MKKIVSLLLCGVMALSMVACGGPSTKEQLVGEWERQTVTSAEEMCQILEKLDFYEEELEICKDLDSDDRLTWTFNEDGTYVNALDPDYYRSSYRDYWERVINALYENRAIIADVYAAPELADASFEDFSAFYAGLYDDTYTDFVDFATDWTTSDYTDEDAIREAGTYTIDKDKVSLTATQKAEDNDTDDGYITVSFSDDGNTLTITYSDGDEVLTKVK
ncbi:MAG: hypothetical protein KBS83_00550 [Lachnospiraceae bacterium]|nr:hypothetical protein [Candidatus Equihabitans merdae]